MDAAGSLIELWRQAGLSENTRLGAFNCDPLGVLAATGTLYYPADRSCEIAAKLAVDCRAMSNVTALLADGRPYHEAGASEAQELAAMLATLVAYLRACEAQGLRPRMALGKIALSLAADGELFLTVAKLRAARVLVARVAEACGAASAGAVMHLSVTTSARMLARRDPVGEHAARDGGVRGRGVRRGRCDQRAALHLGAGQARSRSPGAWRAIPTSCCRRRAGWGASWTRPAAPASIEQLTGALAGKAWELFQDVERQGGMARVLESGFWQGEIARVAEVRSRSIATGRLELTGVSAFPRLGDDGVKVEPHPPAGAGGQGRHVGGGAAGRAGWPRRSRICAMRPMHSRPAQGRRRGCFSPTSAISPPIRRAPPGCAISWPPAVSRRWPARRCTTPPMPARRSPTAAREIACICSSDAVYAELAEATAGALVAAGADAVLLAGRPREQEAALRSAGVGTFVFAGCDAIAVLTSLHEALGVRS